MFSKPKFEPFWGLPASVFCGLEDVTARGPSVEQRRSHPDLAEDGGPCSEGQVVSEPLHPFGERRRVNAQGRRHGLGR
jgi:hypothetical protein